MKQHVYIVGAHSRAQTLKEYITYLYPKTTVVAYLVDNTQGNETEIDGIAVKPICEASELKTDYPVYIATRGIYHAKLTAELKALGMKRIYPVNVKLDNKLRNAYVKKVYAQEGRNFCVVGEDLPARSFQAGLYVATSVRDKAPLESYELLPEERIIQVGAALTRERLPDAAVYDNVGENISEKNRQFCELTAMYWIWKNAKEDVVGLEHYRRHFLLPDNWLEWMYYNHVDVILAVPLYVAPSVEQNYKNRHDAREWDFMMEYLRRHHPRDYEAASLFFKGGLYSPCNMFIMRKKVLDNFCEWLFPILDAVAERSGDKESVYQNRYQGFLSERLMTYFFESRRDKYKLAYANKIFLN